MSDLFYKGYGVGLGHKGKSRRRAKRRQAQPTRQGLAVCLERVQRVSPAVEQCASPTYPLYEYRTTPGPCLG